MNRLNLRLFLVILRLLKLYEKYGFKKYGVKPDNMKYKNGDYASIDWMMVKL